MAVFDFTYTLLDAYTRQSVKHGQIEALDFAAAQAGIVAYLDDLAPITEANIIRYTVTSTVTYADGTVAGANLDEGVTFTFTKADSYKATVKVPAPANAILNADGTVDLANADVVAWAAHFIAGPLYVSDGEVATLLLKGTLDR